MALSRGRMVSLFTAHTENQWVLQKQLLPRAESSALLFTPSGQPQGTRSCHARVAQAWKSGTVHKCCPSDCSDRPLLPRGPSTLGANNSLSSAHRLPLSSHIVSFPRPGEQNLFHRAPVDQPSGLDALSRGWVEPGKPPEQGLNFVCPCTAPSTPRVPLNTTNNHHALAFNYCDATTLKLLPISTKQAHTEVRPSTDCHYSS